MRLVSATTVDEYRKNIEKDAALERRLQPVLIGEPSVDEAIEILQGLKDRYEAHHCVKITEEAIAAAELSDATLPAASSRIRLSTCWTWRRRGCTCARRPNPGTRKLWKRS